MGRRESQRQERVNMSIICLKEKERENFFLHNPTKFHEYFLWQISLPGNKEEVLSVVLANHCVQYRSQRFYQLQYSTEKKLRSEKQRNQKLLDEFMIFLKSKGDSRKYWRDVTVMRLIYNVTKIQPPIYLPRCRFDSTSSPIRNRMRT